MNAKRTIMKHSTIANVFAIAAVTALGLSLTPAANAEGKGCSHATLKGTFSQRGTGFITTPAGLASPMANFGTLTFDGNGGVTGTVVNSLNGNIVPPTGTVKETGTYKVNPDCTGTYTVQIPELGLTGSAFFVIDDRGDELQILTTDPGVVVLCVARRQFPVGDDERE